MSTAFAHTALAIAAALFDSLWEGLLIAGAVWLGLQCLSKLGAATRYAIWLCTLAALLLVPIATVYLSAHQVSELPVNAMVVSEQSTTSAVPAALVAPAAQARIRPTQINPVTPDVVSEPTTVPAAPRTQIRVPQSLAVVAALLWLLVACMHGLKLALNIRALAEIRRQARLWPAGHGYPVFLSTHVDVPLAAGLLRAAVILPASLVEQLRPDALETIIIHEVAHLRRYDVWTNAVARIIEAFVALNPVAWFVMRRLSIEREIACDDWVVARTGSGDAFANVLAGLATRVTSRAPIAAASALGSRHSVIVRIERLLDARPRRLRLSFLALGGALLLFALFAFVLQSVSPVLAYEPQQPVLAQAPAAPAEAKCAVPNHGIGITGLAGGKLLLPPRHSGRYFELKRASEVVAKFGAANVATVDLTVDATGTPRKVVVLSAPRWTGIAGYVTHMLMNATYQPATRNCVPVTATIRTAENFGTPRAGAFSIVTPAYPNGWSAQHASACKVPPLLHWTMRPDGPNTGLPVFPGSMTNMSVDAKYSVSARVRVNGAGAVTSAAIVSSSGQPALDNALLAAARQATYPLTESTGFKPVRPSGAPLSWNAANGSKAYRNCKPAPSEYVWRTTFSRTVPFGIPPGGGGSGLVITD